MKHLTFRALLLAGLAFLIGCRNPDGTIRGQINRGINGENGAVASSAWNFDVPSDFAFDSSQISITGGQAVLKIVDTQYTTQADFDRGSYGSTIWDLGTQKLRINTSSSSLLDVREVLPSKTEFLKAYLKMDLNFNDSSGNSHTANSYGGATRTVNSKTGSEALSLDGVDDYLEIAHAVDLDPQTNWTLSAWIYRSSIGTQDGIIEKFDGLAGTGGFAMRVTSGNKLYGKIFDGTSVAANLSCEGTTNLVANTWYFVSVVFDDSNRTIKCLVNGQSEDSKNSGVSPKPSVSSIKIGQLGDGTGQFFGGRIDDVSVWSAALSDGEVNSIYHLQKQKYSGVYTSPAIHLGASSASWTGFTPQTAFPYLKEILNPGLGSETTTHYSNGVSGLTSGLAALWHLNETSYDTLPAGYDFSDSSGNGYHLLASGVGARVNRRGTFNRAVEFESSNYATSSADGPTLIPNLSPGITFSAWVTPTGMTTDQRIFSLERSGSSSASGLNSGRTSGKFSMFFRTGAAALGEVFTTSDFTAGRTYHVVGTITNGLATIYVDGVKEGEDATVSLAQTLSMAAATRVRLATAPSGGANFFAGTLDEVAVWRRALSAQEVKHLYLRGANRIRYQVRSCAQNPCNDSTEPWLGASGGGTFYSELNNLNPSPLDVLYSNFPVGSRPSNNSYFQFRLFLEADQNLACEISGTPVACLPEISGNVISPSDRYFAGGAEVINQSSVSFSGLMSLTQSSSSACVKYQLSSDNGVSWKWWNGASWATATLGQSHANDLSLLSAAELGQFTSPGNWKFKAILQTNTSGDLRTPCGLDAVNLIYYQ